MTEPTRWRIGPTHPGPGRLGAAAARALARRYFERKAFYSADSPQASRIGAELRRRMAARERVLLLGICPAGHNSGAALIEILPDGTLHVHDNEEEERYTGHKHCNTYPYAALEAVLERLYDIGAGPGDLLAAFATWDYAELAALMVRCTLEEFPGAILVEPSEDLNLRHVVVAAEAPRRLGEQFNLPGPLPVVAVRHHDAHAFGSWALSPWAADTTEPTMVSVVDGFGDDASISMYVAEGGPPMLLQRNDSPFDSLGVLYGVLSSTLGGWPPFSSEGRYMGAAAWGNKNRLTNPYYARLREILHLGPSGQLRLNRALANWPRRGMQYPFTPALEAILGPPIALADMWHPDAVLALEDVEHADITRARVDKAAALQLVFEDGLFHIISHLIAQTGSQRLVMTGGTALNCTANSALLRHFDAAYYESYVNSEGTGGLNVWVPPIPGDAGLPVGAPMAFALRHGASPGSLIQDAFLCGRPARADEIADALREERGVQSVALGSTDDPAVAELVASLIAGDGVVGIFQGRAETGPRALGHRSILANACSRDTLDVINSTVKFREVVRPLAPMGTLEGARELFELEEGASAAGFNAYRWMVLAARARPAAYDRIPAVVHHDGTGRIQIVDAGTDPLCHAVLKSLGRRVGVEICVNTSLNVGTPIVQTPRQAVGALRRARGIDGLLFVAADRTATWAWDVERRPLAAAERFMRAQSETT